MLFSVYMPKPFSAISGRGTGIAIQDPIRIITVEKTLAAALQEAAVPAEVFNKIKKENAKMENTLPTTFEFELSGDYALFSDPITRPGGEKNTLMVPTYEALKGAVKSCYWKPTLVWFIDEVRIMNPFRTETKGVKLRKYGASENVYDLANFTYLKDVRYQVRAHYEWNMNRPDYFGVDRDYKKHNCIMARSLKAGGRFDIFLGTRECQASIKKCVFGEGEGFYDSIDELALGNMYHSTLYPDEATKECNKGVVVRNFWKPVMEYGVIKFPRPEECGSSVVIREMEMKKFTNPHTVGGGEDELV